MARRILLVAAAVLVTALPARAQTNELAVMIGVTPPVALDQHALQIDEARIDGQFTFALQGAHFLSPHWGIEGLFTQQAAAFEISASSFEARLYSMAVDQVHANVVYQFGGANFKPFVFGGIGATFFRAIDIPSETKLSYGIGGGVKYFPWTNVGLRAQVRYKPTRLNDAASGDFCDPFGYCQASLRQVDLLFGVALRF